MDQSHASNNQPYDGHPVTISAPHDWDGIGQALRSAYRDHRDPPSEIATVLHRLDRID